MSPMIRLRPYANAVLKRLNGATPLDRDAAKITLIEPAMEMQHPPCACLEGEFERIKEMAPGDTIEGAKLRVFGGSVTKRPLQRYDIDDVLVYPTGFSTRRATHMRALALPHRELLTGNIAYLPKALSTHSAVSIRYFGHWLSDSCPTSLLRAEDEALLMTHRPAWRHAYDYCRLFDLSPEEPGVYHVSKLTWMDDFGQGPSRMERYRALRRRLRSTLGATDDETTKAPLVYLRRGATGAARNIADEEKLMDRLSAEGFVIVDMNELSVPEIMRAALNAEVCVTIDGSHQNHAFFFLRDKALHLCIQPADRFSLAPLEKAAGYGFDTAFVVADASPDGYVVDVDKILRTIDLWRKQKAATA